MPASQFKHSLYSWLADLVGVACLIGFFYALWIGHHALFTPDEGRYCEIAREMVTTKDYITPRLNGVAFLDKPVLFYWFQASAIIFWGLKEWALRFWPALFGVVGAVATLAIGRLLFNRRTGWLAAILLATSPMYYGAAHYANLDLEVAILISLTLFTLIAGLQQPKGKIRSGLFLLAWPLTALAFLTKGLIAIAFPAMITTFWLIASKQLRTLLEMHLIKGPLLFCIIVLPWYLLVEKANPGFFHFFFITQQVSRFLAHGDFNNPSPWWFYLPIVFAGFLPWSIFTGQAIWSHLRKGGLRSIDGFFLLWLITVLIFFSIPTSKTIGYILPIFPPLAILTAHYLDTHWQQKLRPYALSVVLLLIIVWVALPCITYVTYLQHHPVLPWLINAALIFALIGLLIFILAFKQKTIATSCFILVLGALLFCLFFLAAAPSINRDSIKPLALQLKTTLEPTDEVVTYYRYYQDLPIYLQRRITIVADWQSKNIPLRDNWQRELWYGLPFQDATNWLISEKTLWERWESPHRLIVLMDKRRLDEFKSHAGDTIKQQGEQSDVLWVSNQIRP